MIPPPVRLFGFALYTVIFITVCIASSHWLRYRFPFHALYVVPVHYYVLHTVPPSLLIDCRLPARPYVWFALPRFVTLLPLPTVPTFAFTFAAIVSRFLAAFGYALLRCYYLCFTTFIYAYVLGSVLYYHYVPPSFAFFGSPRTTTRLPVQLIQLPFIATRSLRSPFVTALPHLPPPPAFVDSADVVPPIYSSTFVTFISIIISTLLPTFPVRFYSIPRLFPVLDVPCIKHYYHYHYLLIRYYRSPYHAAPRITPFRHRFITPPVGCRCWFFPYAFIRLRLLPRSPWFPFGLPHVTLRVVWLLLPRSAVPFALCTRL